MLLKYTKLPESLVNISRNTSVLSIDSYKIFTDSLDGMVHGQQCDQDSQVFIVTCYFFFSMKFLAKAKGATEWIKEFKIRKNLVCTKV